MTNRLIIYKFLKKGFSALTAEDLANTIVDGSFSVDFAKYAKEDWNTTYLFKAQEKL